MIKQIRKQSVCVIPADGAEDHIDLRIPESLQQISGALIRMIFYIFDPFESVRHELHVQTKVFQTFDPDLQLVLYKIFPDRSCRQTDDSDILYHMIYS